MPPKSLSIDGVLVQCRASRNSCPFPPTKVDADIAESPERHGLWVLEHALHCNVHAAARERRKYQSPPRWVPVMEATAFLARLVAVRAEREAEQAIARKAEDERVTKIHALEATHEWIDRDLPYEAVIVEEAHWRRDSAPVQKVVVRPKGDAESPVDRFDRGFEIEWTQTEGGPRRVRINSTGSFGTSEARALIEGIAKMIELNEATNVRLAADGRTPCGCGRAMVYPYGDERNAAHTSTPEHIAWATSEAVS